MTIEKHINIAAAALRHGFIDMATFLDIVASLRGDRGRAPMDEVWLESGHLTEQQLELIVRPYRAPDGGTEADTPPAGSLAQGTARLGPVAERGKAPSIPTIAMRAQPAGGRSGQTELDAAAEWNARPDVFPEANFGSEATPPEPTLTPLSGGHDLSMLSGRHRYVRQSHLGSGGLGEVTRCHDSLLGRMVAVKTARWDLGPDVQAVLEREARIVAMLEHPNIIPVYDAGFIGGVGPYYVMRVVTERSLADIIEDLAAKKADAVHEYSQKKLLRSFVEICQAVDFAHSKGVVHCDLKPSNILIGDFGEVLVVDWGLAYCAQYPGGARGGTPGYMAPEQCDQNQLVFDAQTDVFALGAILYELITLSAAFPDGLDSDRQPTSQSIRRSQPYAPAVSMRERCGHLRVAAELDEICLRALELEPRDRCRSAREISEAIEDYLEGTRELERRMVEADRCTAAADELAERFFQFVETRDDELDKLAELVEQTPPWAPRDDKRALWNAEDTLSVIDSLRVRTLHAAEQAYEKALENVPSHKAARRGLSRLYWAELKQARHRRDELNEIYYEQMVQRYDDSAKLIPTSAEAELIVDPGANIASLSLAKLREDNRVLVVAETRELPVTSNAPLTLATGLYILCAHAETGGAIVSYPLAAKRGANLYIEVDLSAAARLAADEVMIPHGRALLGDNTGWLDVRRPSDIDVDAFAIMRWPVRVADYLEFLDVLRERDPAAVDGHLPRSALGNLLWQHTGSAWQTSLPSAGGAHELPIFGVSALSAQAFADWKSERDGVSYRLPRDTEWEKAARGTDGRVYPWGNHFDPALCKMRLSRPGPCSPEPMGAYETDKSPYGVRDLAGGVADWIIPDDVAHVSELLAGAPPRHIYSRGGAWCDWASDCRVTTRRTYLPGECAERVGFRLVRGL